MKFRNKLLLGILLFFSVSFGIGGSILISASFKSNMAREKQAAANSYQMVLNMLSVVNSVSTQSYYMDIVNTLKQLEERGGGSWIGLRLSDAEHVIYESSAKTQHLQDWERSLEKDHFLLQIFKEDEVYYLQISGQLEAGEKILYLDGLYDITGIYDARVQQQIIYRNVYLVVLAGAFLVFWMLTVWMTKPLGELSKAAREITEGKYSSRARVYTRDEIGQLAEDFNHMADRLEHHIAQLQEAMERQEEFMGSFAHELKTPMTSIIGYADLLRSQELSSSQRRDAANYIFSEGKRLESLSLKLLDLLVLKKHAANLAPANIQKLILSAVQLMKPALKEAGITAEVQGEPGMCGVDADLVVSLLINLLDNARKSMEHGGTICIFSELTDNGCRIFVEDQGRGIPEEERDKITEAFYRVDKSRSRAQGGVGLGLTLCQEIVKLHQGTMRFESRTEGGTRAVVELRGGRET